MKTFFFERILIALILIIWLRRNLQDGNLFHPDLILQPGHNHEKTTSTSVITNPSKSQKQKDSEGETLQLQTIHEAKPSFRKQSLKNFIFWSMTFQMHPWFQIFLFTSWCSIGYRCKSKMSKTRSSSDNLLTNVSLKNLSWYKKNLFLQLVHSCQKPIDSFPVYIWTNILDWYPLKNNVWEKMINSHLKLMRFFLKVFSSLHSTEAV